MGFAGAGEMLIRTDDAEWRMSGAETALVGSGCRCCTIRSDLVAALRRLLADRERGRIAHFGRVVIETGERTDPLPILRTFMTDRALGAEFHVDVASALADASFGDDLSSVALTENRPLAWETFSRLMETLVATRGADLLLVAGLLDIEGARGPVAVQSMQHLSLPPVELAAWPDEDRRSRISFITRSIPEGAVRRMFDAVRALA
jgi:G3E family GTPase